MSSNWELQSEANISSFIFEDEYKERCKVFKKLYNIFKKNDINWALACFANLFFRGIVDDFHDLDILVASEDAEKIPNLLNSMGAKLIETGSNGFCASNTYYRYKIDGVDIDLISGFRVITFETQYLYEFNKKEVIFYEVENMKIPLIAAEAQYLLYFMMEGWQEKRRFKRMLIQEFLKSNGINFPLIFRKKEIEKLPAKIQNGIKNLMTK